MEASDVAHGRVGESLRECHIRLNQCTSDLARLENRMRTQDWYHDLSEQESSDEIHQVVEGRPRATTPRCMVMQARVPLGELDQWINQLRHDVQTHGLDNDSLHQRVTRFLTEHQRREANSRTDLEQKVV